MVWRKAIATTIFTVTQVWIAMSLQLCRRPRLPVSAASRVMSRSSQIVSEPRHLSGSLEAGGFVVLSAGGVGLLIHPSYHAEFTTRIPEADLCSRGSLP